MFLGHGVAAFALVGAVAAYRGVDRNHALRLAIVAGLFATVADVDILYGPLGLVNGVSGVFDAADTFWQTGNVVHRGPTHSMLLGAVTAGAVALWYRHTQVGRLVALGLLAGVVAIAAVVSGSIAGAVTLVFAIGCLGIGRFAGRFDLSTQQVLATGLVGLLSHPLGDLFTGEPPRLLYPLDVPIVTERIALSTDPTLHLLGAFAIELTIIWLGLFVLADLTERKLPALVDRKALLGVAYGGAAMAIPAPTLETSFQFVFTVLAVGGLGLTQRELIQRELRSFGWFRAAATGMGAVTVAAISYLVVYLVV